MRYSTFTSLLVAALLLLPSMAAADSEGAVYVPNGGAWENRGNPVRSNTPPTVVHPTDGVVVMPMGFRWEAGTVHTANEGLAYVAYSVTQLSTGAVLDGTLSYDGGDALLIWRGTTAFALGETYRVRALFENARMNSEWGALETFADVDIEFDLAVVGGASGAVVFDQIGATLIELDTRQCENQFVPALDMIVSLDVPESFLDYIQVTVEPSAEDPAAVCADNGGERFLCEFERQDLEQYCATVTAFSRFDNSSTTETLCVSESERVERTAPDEGCLDSVDAGCQCDAVSSPSDSSPLGRLALVFVAVLIFVARKRGAL